MGCILCFEESSNHIEVQVSEDSIHTKFKIIREGFETQLNREKAMEKYKQNFFEPYPDFYMKFFSTQKREILSSIAGLCKEYTDLNKFRKKDYQRPKGTHSSLFVFLQKLSDNHYLKWNVVLEPVE